MTTRVKFRTADVLRLQVEDNPTGLVNLVANPDGEFGGWGWITPQTDTIISGEPAAEPYGTRLRLTKVSATALAQGGTESFDVVPGAYVSARVDRLDDSATSSSGVYSLFLAFRYYDSAGALITQSASRNDDSAGPGVVVAPAEQVPAGAVSASLRVFGGTLSHQAGEWVSWSHTTVATASTAAALAGLPSIPATPYVDVLGSTHSIAIDRDELDVGTVTANIYDSELDPAKATSIMRPGRRLRVLARVPATDPGELDAGEGGATDWTPIFTGKIDQPAVVYDLLQRDPQKRSRITVTAVDPVTALAREPRPDGVATIDELPYVLEGCGVPWNCNGSGNQVPTATVVATNDQAYAVDQVSITRDSVLGYAWVDRFGVLQAWDADKVDTRPGSAGGVTVLDGGDYGDIDLGWDIPACINAVELDVLRDDPDTGEAEQVTFGPYRDEASVKEFGVQSATYTVQGIDDDPAVLAAYAQQILDANSVPRVRANSVTVPIKYRRAIPKALLDLYDPVTVTNDVAAYSELLRVVSVSHAIDTSSWTLTLGFAGTERVAAAQVTPAPSTGSASTLRQLLRPVGEMTMWFGARSAVPAGWLVADGSTFDGNAYPALAALLGSSTLPNLTDRFPIGAGTKALGSAGGNPTKPIDFNVQPNTATGGTANRVNNITTPLDVMPPWRAVWFIIRAV